MENYSENVSMAFEAYLEGTISEVELHEVVYEGKTLDFVKTAGRRAKVSLTNNFNNIKDEWTTLLNNAKSKKVSDKFKIAGQVVGIGVGAILMAAKGMMVGPADWLVTSAMGCVIVPLSELNFPFNPTPTLKKLVIDPALMEVARFHENTAKTIQEEVKSATKRYEKVIADVESGKIPPENAEAAITKAQSDLEAAAKKLDALGAKLKADANKKIAEKYKDLSPEEKAKVEGKEPEEKKGLAKKYDEMRAKDKEKAIKLVDSTKKQIQDSLEKHKK